MTGHSDHSAEGSAAGFAFQWKRALIRLSEAPIGSVIGVETIDDIVVTEISGRVDREQAKFTLSADGSTFGNRSINLWKTLCIWVESYVDDANEKTRFLLVTNDDIAVGLACSICNAKTEIEITACLDLIKNEPLRVRKSKNIALLVKRSPTIADYIEKIQNTDESILRHMVERIESCGNADMDDSELIGKLNVPPWVNPQEAIADLLGWLEQVALGFWKSGQAALISKHKFTERLDRLIEIRRKSKRIAGILRRSSLTKDLVMAHMSKPFVFQIELIAPGNDALKLQAIGDYYDYRTERLRILNYGDILESDWDQYYASLTDEWERISVAKKAMSKDQLNCDIGLDIYFTTMNRCRARLADYDIQNKYFWAGSYHGLADDKMIWWHPDYNEMAEGDQ